jgi:hypothetical protein
MTLDQIDSSGEIVGVVISLVYLAIQIRENTETERNSTCQSIVSGFGALNSTMTSTPELSRLFVRAMENHHQLSADEKARVSQLFFPCFRYFEHMFYQHQKGYLEEEVWIGWKRLMLIYNDASQTEFTQRPLPDLVDRPFAVGLRFYPIRHNSSSLDIRNGDSKKVQRLFRCTAGVDDAVEFSIPI